LLYLLPSILKKGPDLFSGTEGLSEAHFSILSITNALKKKIKMPKLIPVRKQPIYSMLVCLLFTLHAFSQQPAFPGAEGAGRFTTGGRGTSASPTTVFEVTNLSDDGLPGSLRYALTTTASHRTVVFRVSGTIRLNSKLNIRANTTIAGQTAPGDGICIADHPVVINGDNVIVRYMRFRLGDRHQKKVDANGNPVNGSGGDDAFGGLGVSNIIIDHCSVSWSSDEALTIYRGDNLTIQWCFITEPLNYSYHWETGDTDWQRHGFGGIWGAKTASMHHNLFAHCNSRNPRFAGISTYSPNSVGVENVDFRNNVIYNWGINSVLGGEGGNYNLVNNYYKYGPSTSSSVRYRVANPGFTSTIPYGKWYINGNYVDGSAANTSLNWKGVVMQSGNAADTSLAKVLTPFDLGHPLMTHTAQDAYEYVLQGAGCSLVRDTLDQRIVMNVRNRTGTIIDVQGGYPHGTAFPQTVNAWPALSSVTPPVDTDKDGMPDSWEIANNLNPNDANDRMGIASNGYTNLENYLNSLVSVGTLSNPTVFINGSLNSFNQTLGNPSATQSLTVSGQNLTGPVSVQPPVNYQVSADGGTTWFSNASPLILNPAAGILASTTILTRLNASTTGVSQGNIIISSAGASNTSLAVTGITSSPLNISGIGRFPEMDGGFERQPAGATVVSATHTSTTKWQSASPFNIDSLVARTGTKSMKWNNASTSNKYIFTPVLSANPLQSSTQYVVQFWYRVASPLVNNIAGTSDLKLYGYSTMVGSTGGTNSTISGLLNLNSSSPSGANWNLFSSTLTTTADAPTSSYAGLRITYPQSPYFEIDDFVVYPGSAVDNTAPDPVTSPVASLDYSDNSITLSWQAPSSGVDGGGYMVVRSAGTTPPVPNTKGVYVAGNKIGADTVLYTGSSNSFTDTDLVQGITYNYFIYTADKAFNYSSAVLQTAALTSNSPEIITSGTLNNFSQNMGTPSAVQTYSVTGSSLTNAITITPPAGYEISANGGTSWSNNSNSISLTPSNGVVPSTTISVRLNAGSQGSYSGNIIHSSQGATTLNAFVNGVATLLSTPPAGTAVTVAMDGSGNFTSIQAAINAAPTNSTQPYIIYIKNGKYKEKITIPSNKPFIHLIGESIANTILTWDDYSGKPIPGGGVYGTANSASVTINAPDCMVKRLTIENTTGDAPQAVALNVNADRVQVISCRLLGGQDTLLTNGTGRQYFKDCYIDGTVDFIFGSAKAIFDSTVLYPKTRQDGLTGSYITAANTPQGQDYGYVFRDCVIPSNFGTTSYVLGRPWQNDGTQTNPAHNKTVFINTTYGNNIIKPEGWSTWTSGTNTSIITYGEYRSRRFDSSLIDVSQRVSWSYQFSASQAAAYNFTNIFGSWDPCANGACNIAPKEIAVSNFKARKGSSTTPSLIRWNISWPMAGVKYELYRSSDNISFVKVNEQISANDSSVNYSYSDAIPAAGTNFYYYLKASKNSFNTHISDTIIISSVPTITVNGALNAFLQGIGTPSGVQTYTVSGVNMTDNITITPPAPYEISLNGTSWVNSSSSIVLTPSNNTIASTTISVRLNGTAAGSYPGVITHLSNGATTVNQAVAGTIQTAALANSIVLQHWPMTQNNLDSATVRSAGVTASTPSFSNFFSSNGTTVAIVPAYSPARGQAFGPGASGNGMWTTATGGNGGNLNRRFYEQFTVTAKQGYNVRVDSVIMTSAFYNSSSNTRLAVVYSFSGFTTDSADVTATAGTFTSPILLPNQTAGPTTVHALSFNAATGLTLNAGQTLTFRVYYSCGSSTEGRYALLKDVMIKGDAISTAPPPSLSVTGVLNSFNQVIGSPGASQSYNITGSNLTGDVTVTPPAGFQVSKDGGNNWSSNSAPLMITPVNGTANETITVRLNSSTSGNFSGNISHATAGLSTINLAVNGTAIDPPSIIVTGSLVAFAQTAGTPSAVQTYTVSGQNLNEDISITAPTGFEISSNGGTTWTSSNPIIITHSGGTIATTTISVRLNASGPGTYSGNITHISSGAPVMNQAVNGITVNAPEITVTGTLNTFTQNIGTPGAVQTYSVSGAALTSGVMITPPPSFEVSADGGTTWFTNTNPLTLQPSGGVVNLTTISVRLHAANAGSYTGDIIHESSGAQTINRSISGTAFLPPVFTVSGTLTNFSQTAGTPSAIQSYSVSGSNLTGNVTITPPVNYQVSSNGGTTWFSNASPLILTPVTGSIPTTLISVRLNAAAPGNYSGNITNASPGVNTINVSVSGTTVPQPVITVTGTLNPFSQTIGAPSAVQTYTVSGTNLTASIIVTAPAGYEISSNSGSTWSGTVTLTQTGGTVASTVISVRLNATTAGNYTGNIVHTSTGANVVNQSLSGTAVRPPSIVVRHQLVPFLQILGSPSPAQSYTVLGADLTADITISPSARFEISIDGGTTWNTTPQTLVRIAGTVPQTNVLVRLNGNITGAYSGQIIHSTSGTAAISIPLSGNITTSQVYGIYPIPASSVAFIVHPSTPEIKTITLFSEAGQKIGVHYVLPNTFETRINLSRLMNGLYFVEIGSGTERKILRMIKR
jgi:pectin methylesterase-like acyl-CoA thioesterase